MDDLSQRSSVLILTQLKLMIQCTVLHLAFYYCQTVDSLLSNFTSYHALWIAFKRHSETGL